MPTPPRAIPVLACLPLLFPLFLAGQGTVAVEHATLRRLTTDDGLPQGLVRDILQDRRGYLWFSTKDGLARSDGYTMTVFRHDPTDPASISGDHTTYLREDSAGFLWVGVKGSGLDRYDPRTLHFTAVRPGAGLSPEHYEGIEDLHPGPDGNIWTVSEEELPALVVADGTDGLELRLPEAVYPEWNFLARAHRMVNDGQGGLWMIGRDTLRLVPLGRPGVAVRDWPVPPPTPDEEGRFHGHELVAQPDRERVHVLLSTMVVTFSTRTLMPLDTLHLPEGHHLHELGVLDRDGDLWYKDKGDRTCRVSLNDGGVTRMILRTDRDETARDLQLIGWRCQDDQGNLWAGTGGYGALQLTWSGRLFQTWPSRNGQGMDVVEHEVLGHVQFGLFRPSADGGRSWEAPLERSPCFGCPHGTTLWDGAATDDQGRVWGIRDHGEVHPPELGVMGPDGTVVTRDLGLKGHRPLRVFPERDGGIWVLAGPDNGEWRVGDELVRYRTEDGRVTGRFPLPRPLNRREYWPVAQWSQAPDATIWIGTIDGLLHFAPAQGTFQEYRHDPADSTSLPSNMIFSLCPDPAEPGRALWVGTEGGGLARLDTRTGRCRRYDVSTGLPNNVIYGVLPDADGELYLSTNVGLVRFDPRNGTSVLFTSEDGLPGNEFNRYGSALGPDGRMYFEGMEGGVSFHPEALKGSPGGSRTRLTTATGMNQSLPVVFSEGAVWTPEGRQEALELPYDIRMLSLGFSVMDHTAPGKNQYRYRMSGLHQEWVYNGASNRATFTNLDPGRYTFLVQGRNSAGIWDPVGASLTVVITPPWWGTWWFRTLLVLLVAGLLYALYRYRLARAMEVVRVRDRIARDLHDEIGSTLSSVALYSTVARNKAGDRVPEATAMLDRITESTTEVMEAMNDIVWAVNADNDDMAHVVQRMRAFAVRIAEAAGMGLRMEVAEGVERVPVGMEQRKNLYLIFKEAVNNAVKYSRAQEVRIALAREGSRLVLEVSDDGAGFDARAVRNDRSTGGNGLANMHDRATEMGGSLTLRSTLGTGTSVRLRFDPRSDKSFDPMSPAASSQV